MNTPHNRRDFLRAAAVTGFGVWIGTEARAQNNPKSPNDKLNFACIGVGGKGDSDSRDAGRLGNVVAICDVDDNTLNYIGERKFPMAKRYNDYRKMLDEMGKEIDAEENFTRRKEYNQLQRAEQNAEKKSRDENVREPDRCGQDALEYS